MNLIVFLIVYLFSKLFTINGIVQSPGLQFTSKWVDTSLCASGDTMTDCQAKKTKCFPVAELLSPEGGQIKAIFTCANKTGVTVNPTFYQDIGSAYTSGKLEDLVSKVSPDSRISSVLRLCILNSTGMLTPELTLNRTALLLKAMTSPNLEKVLYSVSAAIVRCPQPKNLNVSPFITCIKKNCMKNASTSKNPVNNTSKTSNSLLMMLDEILPSSNEDLLRPETVHVTTTSDPLPDSVLEYLKSYLNKTFPQQDIL